MVSLLLTVIKSSDPRHIVCHLPLKTCDWPLIFWPALCRYQHAMICQKGGHVSFEVSAHDQWMNVNIERSTRALTRALTQGSKLQQKSAFPLEKFVWNLLFRTLKHFSESIPATEFFVIVLNAYKSKWPLFWWISHFLNFENQSSTSDFMALFLRKSWLEIYFSTSIFTCLGKAENQ